MIPFQLRAAVQSHVVALLPSFEKMLLGCVLQLTEEIIGAMWTQKLAVN